MAGAAPKTASLVAGQRSGGIKGGLAFGETQGARRGSRCEKEQCGTSQRTGQHGPEIRKRRGAGNAEPRRIGGAGEGHEEARSSTENAGVVRQENRRSETTRRKLW